MTARKVTEHAPAVLAPLPYVAAYRALGVAHRADVEKLGLIRSKLVYANRDQGYRDLNRALRREARARRAWSERLGVEPDVVDALFTAWKQARRDVNALADQLTMTGAAR